MAKPKSGIGENWKAEAAVRDGSVQTDCDRGGFGDLLRDLHPGPHEALLGRSTGDRVRRLFGEHAVDLWNGRIDEMGFGLSEVEEGNYQGGG